MSCGGCLLTALVSVIVVVFVLAVFVLPHAMLFAHPKTSEVGPAHAASSAEVRGAAAAAARQDGTALDQAAPAPRWTPVTPDVVGDRCETTHVLLCSRTTRRTLSSTGDPGTAAATLDRTLRAHGWTPYTAGSYVRNKMTLYVAWTAPAGTAAPTGTGAAGPTLTLVLEHRYWSGPLPPPASPPASR